ncbi:MAG: hypothetical protein QOD66_2832, partial [Solirubrobacteraceae bacterium]|nr:hypothetical protein [Solirubrobacteraceae bacterium]
DEESEQTGLLFVSHAAVAWAKAPTHDQLAERVRVEARDLIGQAKGILMERYKIDALAFALLVRTSQHTTRPSLRGRSSCSRSAPASASGIR